MCMASVHAWPPAPDPPTARGRGQSMENSMHAPRSWIIAAALAVPLVFTLGCDDDDDDGNGGPSGTTVLVTSDFDNQSGVVNVSNDGTASTGATVSLNGTAATPGAAGVYNIALLAPL